MPAPVEHREQHTQEVPVANQHHRAPRAQTAQLVDERTAARVHVLDGLTAAPAHLADIDTGRGLLGDQLVGASPLKLAQRLFARERGQAQLGPEPPGDDLGRLDGATLIAGDDDRGGAAQQRRHAFRGLGGLRPSPHGQRDVQGLALQAPRHVPLGFAVSHQDHSHAATLAAALSPRGVGLLAGTLADALIPDPARHHPVAWFGSYAAAVERLTYRDSRVAGVAHVAGCLAPLAVAGVAVEHATRTRPLARAAATAVVTWAVTGGHSLAREGQTMAGFLEAGDLDGARGRLGHLCGRDPDGLEAPELARAALESVAENTADAVVAPLVWGAVAGIPGLLLHRGINTLDAIVGHHNARYENFGWAAARLDDAACWLPARLTGLTACLLAGARRADAWRVMRRDAHDHPSPNGGWCESAFAGALGVQLGGRNIYYGGRVEHRGLLGDGPRPGASELCDATRLELRVQWATAAVAAACCGLASTLIRRRRRS